MKHKYMMIFMMISGPTQLRNDIDVKIVFDEFENESFHTRAC